MGGGYWIKMHKLFLNLEISTFKKLNFAVKK